jgi:hypothetical protein
MRNIRMNQRPVRSCENGGIPRFKNNLISVTFPRFLRSSSSEDSIRIHHDVLCTRG